MASVAILSERIQRGIEAGELPVGTNASKLAGFYVSVLQGMSVQARDGASRETPAFDCRRCDARVAESGTAE
jgi:hypothetical protein